MIAKKYGTFGIKQLTSFWTKNGALGPKNVLGSWDPVF